MIVFLLAFAATAHDLWLSPSSWDPAPGAPVRVRLLLGEELRPERVRPLERPRVERWTLGDVELETVDGASPVLDQVVPRRAWLSLETLSETAVQGDAFFQEYVESEGLRDILGARRMRRPARVDEEWSRSLKVLLGPAGGDEVATAPVGLTYELVPQTDPARLSPGDTLTVQVLHLGRVLPERWVTAWHRDADGLLTEVKALSDPDGVVQLVLPHAGGWLLRSVHMVQVSPERYRSWWTAVGFAVPAAE